ncbi:Uncharacterised protein [Mycobacteroides abscessus subsp. abscessus]|nr:Uncharacterised protein [Mycobacteroides abscessus subsp. abscessus]
MLAIEERNDIMPARSEGLPVGDVGPEGLPCSEPGTKVLLLLAFGSSTAPPVANPGRLNFSPWFIAVRIFWLPG